MLLRSTVALVLRMEPPMRLHHSASIHFRKNNRGGAAQKATRHTIMAETYTTFVFSATDVDAEKALRRELLDRFPFGGDQAVSICGLMAGDALSVADAVRMALECRALSDGELRDFVNEMSEQLTWGDCLALAEKWELVDHDGEFVDARRQKESA
jgi:hypothetical protein